MIQGKRTSLLGEEVWLESQWGAYEGLFIIRGITEVKWSTAKIF